MNHLVPVPPDDQDDDVPLRPHIDSIDVMGKVMLCVGKTKSPPGYVFAEPGVDGLNTVIESHQIKRLFASGQLAFVSAPETALEPNVRAALMQPWGSFTDEQKQEIARRLKYVEALDALGPGFSRSVKLQPVCDAVALKIGDHKAHGWFNVYRWWMRWDSAGRDRRALKPHNDKRGNRDSRLAGFQEVAIKEAIEQTWLLRRRVSMATAQTHANNAIAKELGGHDATSAAIQAGKHPLVSYHAVRRRCRKLDRVTRLHSRHGAEATRNELTPVGAGVEVRLPFERVETDFKYVGVFLVDERTKLPLGTPYLMASFDCFSGGVAGFAIGFAPPGSALSSQCLKNTISFKDLSDLRLDEDGDVLVRNSWPYHGVPMQFVADWDVGYHSTHMSAAAHGMGCKLHFVPVGQPWKKGHIERFWRTCQQIFFEMFPGKTLRLMDKPGQDYNPADDAVLTLRQFKIFLTKAIVDYHNQAIDEESGLKRVDLWRQGLAVHTPKKPRHHDDLMELVGAYANRKAERRGIRIFGLRYNSRELAAFRTGFREDPRVDVRYDPEDLGKIWAIDPGGGRAIPIPCTRPDYATGLTLHQHRVIRAKAANRYGVGKRRLLMQELLNARAELWTLAEKMIGGIKRRAGRQRLAHFLGADQSILDAYRYRRHDPETSRGHLIDNAGAPQVEFDIDDDFGDPEDDAKAREDERFVDELKGKSKNDKPKGRKSKRDDSDDDAGSKGKGGSNAAAPAETGVDTACATGAAESRNDAAQEAVVEPAPDAVDQDVVDVRQAAQPIDAALPNVPDPPETPNQTPSRATRKPPRIVKLDD